MNIAVFFHGLFFLGDPPELLPGAYVIIREQMELLESCGLLDAAGEFHVGINGGEESADFVTLAIPKKAKVMMHGLQSRSENLTLIALQRWVQTHRNWVVFYFHAKGCTRSVYDDYGKFVARWRRCMMTNVVENWRRCLWDLVHYDAVGCHWRTGIGSDHSQHYFAGNCWAARASFIATIPSMLTRARIKQSGVASLESRYEAEVILGNGPRLPIVRDYAKGHALFKCP